MKPSRSRILTFVLLFSAILALSLPAVQKALGGSQAAAWVNARFLPLVLNDHLAVRTPTPTLTATPTETPTPSATPFCRLPSPTPTKPCTSTSTVPCTPTPTHPPIVIPTSNYPALKLTVAQSPLTIFPPIMIYTAKLMVLIPIPATGVKVDFYNLAGTGLEYLGSGEIGTNGEAVLNRQMCPGTYTAIARAAVSSLELWSNPVSYIVH